MQFNLISTRLNEIRRIDNIRLIKEKQPLLFKSFYNLGIFVIHNFEIPKSHKIYIYKHLNIDENMELMEGFIKQYKNYEGNINLELPLRALECFFLWTNKNEFDYEGSVIDELKFRISSLHYHICQNDYDENL